MSCAREQDQLHAQLAAECHERERVIQVTEEQSRDLHATMRNLVKKHLTVEDE